LRPNEEPNCTLARLYSSGAIRKATPIFNGEVNRSRRRRAFICMTLTAQQGDNAMSLGTIVLIILVIALLGGFSGLGGGPFYGTGYYGGGGLGLILVIVLVLVLLGKF
jgi:Protein of unknown function (DUF3309)